jgi:putative ABC transport system permease protein
VLRLAVAGLRARGGRTALAALGVLAASIVVGTAATVGYGLLTGFDRAAARAGLPDVIARFDPEALGAVDRRVRALPNLAARSYRREYTDVPLLSTDELTGKGAVEVLAGGRRGYAIVAGRDLRPGRAEVVVERGVARELRLRPGDPLEIGGGSGAAFRVTGIAVAPDNVAYPLAKAARVYVGAGAALRARLQPNVALLWLHDRARADVTLTQARAVSFGLGRLEFVTRDGVRILLAQAAGIVIALLVAFSLVALVAAGTMLAAGADAEVRRRLPAFGVQRALGFSPGALAGLAALEAALLAVPAAVLGLAVGAAAVAGPSGELLSALNELPPGAALLGPLAACLAGVTAVVVAAATAPAWRAARRPPAEILRGGDLAGAAPASGARGGLPGLGVRFATAARGRWAAAVATIAVCAGVVTLMLALASLLERLRDDPGTVGKRYQLAVSADPSQLGAIRALPGVAGAAERFQVDAADAFRLGETLRLVAYAGEHTAYEAPPLAEGRRLRGPGEVEVGLGLADALGLRPGSVLAAQLPSGAEARFRVAGVVRALEHGGRIAWVHPRRLLAANPGLAPQVAVKLDAGADRATVQRRLTALGAVLRPVAAAQTDDARFLGVLAAVLRGVGLAVGLVCLYALVQALSMTARERRGAVALLRACGAGRDTVALVLAGAAAAVAVPAALAGAVLELVAFGPLVARLAAGFATLPLAASPGQLALVSAGLLVLAGAATCAVARRVLREPVVAGLREDA